MLSTLSTWLQAHAASVAMLGTLGVVLLCVTVFATPWLVGRLPADYFTTPRDPLRGRGLPGLLLLCVRNAVGASAMLLGVIMMITPGPGLVMLLIGLSLCEFPGKHRVVRQLASRPSVFASLNWLRRRGRRPPFLAPDVRT